MAIIINEAIIIFRLILDHTKYNFKVGKIFYTKTFNTFHTKVLTKNTYDNASSITQIIYLMLYRNYVVIHLQAFFRLENPLKRRINASKNILNYVTSKKTLLYNL